MQHYYGKQLSALSGARTISESTLAPVVGLSWRLVKCWQAPRTAERAAKLLNLLNRFK
jgi:hypothetical protein